MFQAPRGTRDLLPAEHRARDRIAAVAREQARLCGYGFIEPPTFESAELYSRGVGEATDIVEKEMYVFEDRGGDRLALRPEGTASVCRAYLQHGMANLPQPVKLAYIAPMFRYERPQAGRFRQHTQFGVEALGVRDPALDAEVIDLGWRIAEQLGLRDLVLLINSIGDLDDRRAYVPKLKAHFEPHLDRIAPDDRARFQRAPMRLLDSKDERTRPYQQGAPIITEHLSPESAAYYDAVKAQLDALGIPYEERPSLVRGLDYYTHTVFELAPNAPAGPPETSDGPSGESPGGSQTTLLAGGRYDGLIEQIGGPPTPGVGFGMGLDRFTLQLREQGLVDDAEPPPDVVIAALGERASAAGGGLAGRLRRAGLAATLAFGGRSLKAQLRHAGRSGCRWAIIIGDRDLAAGSVALRDMRGGEQRDVALDAVVAELAREIAQQSSYTESG